MNKIFSLLLMSGVAVVIGTVIMYNVESGAENSKMTTLLDALWWCVATVTTVGYGDVVPVTNLGRVVALVYMFFGITLIAIVMSVITTTFYKRKFQGEESKWKEEEINALRNVLIERLSEIESKQSQCIETVNNLRLSIVNRGTNDTSH
jgi:hypothetical protein